MCRAPIYFKGLYKKQEEWANEAYEAKVSDIFGEYFEQTLETGIEDANEFVEIFHKSCRKELKASCMKEIMSDLKNLEKTHRFLRHEQVDQEEIEDVHYYGDYYSDRALNSKNQFRERPRQPPPPRRASRNSQMYSRGRR
jgi:hypothetical protein